VAVHLVIMLIKNEVFITFNKLKYILTTLLVDYLTLRIYIDKMRYCSRNIALM